MDKAISTDGQVNTHVKMPSRTFCKENWPGEQLKYIEAMVLLLKSLLIRTDVESKYSISGSKWSKTCQARCTINTGQCMEKGRAMQGGCRASADGPNGRGSVGPVTSQVGIKVADAFLHYCSRSSRRWASRNAVRCLRGADLSFDVGQSNVEVPDATSVQRTPT